MSRVLSLVLSVLALIGVAFSAVADTNTYSVESADKAFFAQIQKAVSDGNHEWLATNISYPLSVDVDDQKLELKSVADFKKHSARLLTPNVKAAVQKQTSATLFKNWMGVKIGNGEIWFSKVRENIDGSGNWVYRIIALNPKIPKEE